MLLLPGYHRRTDVASTALKYGTMDAVVATRITRSIEIADAWANADVLSVTLDDRSRNRTGTSL